MNDLSIAPKFNVHPDLCLTGIAKAAERLCAAPVPSLAAGLIASRRKEKEKERVQEIDEDAKRTLVEFDATVASYEEDLLRVVGEENVPRLAEILNASGFGVGPLDQAHEIAQLVAIGDDDPAMPGWATDEFGHDWLMCYPTDETFLGIRLQDMMVTHCEAEFGHQCGSPYFDEMARTPGGRCEFCGAAQDGSCAGLCLLDDSVEKENDHVVL